MMVNIRFLFFFFFFSSRRRHTRLQGDWSSDVCSSDLRCRQVACGWRCRMAPNTGSPARTSSCRRAGAACIRSGERRVGEEGRYRGSPYHLKKKKKREQNVRQQREYQEVSRCDAVKEVS